MKPRNKIVLGALVVLLTVAAGVFTALYRAPKPEPAADDTPLPEMETPQLPAYEIVTSQAAAREETREADDLSERLIQAGTRTVLATLPEGSVMVGKPELAMTENREATLTGEVAVPPQNGVPQKSYVFQIKLAFLPEGDSEAAFPEFHEIAAH